MPLPSPIDLNLQYYVLHLADNALVLGHRNSEWTGYGPILEQDIALSNIALDLVGQARYLYQYAARIVNERPFGKRPFEEEDAGAADTRSTSAVFGQDRDSVELRSDSSVRGLAGVTREGAAGATEDTLAYGRDAWDFRNCLLVEQANGDWGKTILRQFLFSAWQFYFYDRLRESRDSELAAIAEKSHKEVIYHLRWSSEWVIRLGDGTEESHDRMEKALDQLWKFTGELFVPAGYEKSLVAAGIAVDVEALRTSWEKKVGEIFAEAHLAWSGAMTGISAEAGARAKSQWMQTGGKEGQHTEELGYLLAEMQFLQRAYPGCEW
jgi:ring-1,2-phenylacetyl-CoA epoxidase subunit PaaC